MKDVFAIELTGFGKGLIYIFCCHVNFYTSQLAKYQLF